MRKLSAINGWLWIRHGSQIFRKRPLETMFVFFTMLFCYLLISALPAVGPLLLSALIPAFGMGMMQACRDIDDDQVFQPGVLFVAFKSPAFKRLCVLGLIEFCAMLISFFLAMAIDGGFFADLANKRIVIDENALKDAKNVEMLALNFMKSFAIARLFYLPAMMAFWFAPALIMWHGMGLRKSMFYSFFAVWRSRTAFITYFLLCCGLIFGISALLGLIASIGPTVASLANALSLPIALVFPVIMYCSFYSTYKDVFSRDQSASS